jgi:uncharacterized protein
MAFDVEIFATRFLGIFIEAAPFLLLGSLASGLIEAFVSRDDIARIMPKNPILATLVGTSMGFVFPVCECGVVPVVRRLYRKGMPISASIAFLVAAPVMNPVVIASTYAAFGFSPIFYGRFILTFIVASTIGLIFLAEAIPQRLLRPSAVMMPISGGSMEAPSVTTSRIALLPGLRQALVLARGEFFDMGRFLVFGSLLAAAMGTFAFDQEIQGLASNPVNSVFVMMLTAFILSVCSTVDAFLALAFTGSFTTGSVLAFLVFGPMVDIKSTMMFLGVFKRRVVVYLIVLPFLLTALLTIFLNLNVRF